MPHCFFFELKVSESERHRSQDHRKLVDAEERFVCAQRLIDKANERASESKAKFEKQCEDLHKVIQEKNSLEMELKFKERECELLSTMHEKEDKVFTQFLQEKIRKKKMKIKKLKEELHRKECEFQFAHQKAQILQNELSLAQFELKEKREEVRQLQREKDELASSYHAEQYNKLLQITIADKEEMKVISDSDSLPLSHALCNNNAIAC